MINLDDFDYELPKERIAQYPEKIRDRSKLMVLQQKLIDHRVFYQIVDEIEKGDLIILNNSKVIAANLKGMKETGGKIEILFLKEIDSEKKIWECLIKGKKLRPGVKLILNEGLLKGTILEWKMLGQFIVQFSSNESIKKILNKHAEIVLPPYIKAIQDDLSRYQTVYATMEGSVAAPTAGFHLTHELINKIEKKGGKFSRITLHVGYSTFMSLNNEILSSHEMDPEYFLVSPSLNRQMQESQDANARIIALGTTTLKALESAVDNKGRINTLNGWSTLFISPGYKFKSRISHLITNFHMPKSSPLLMVCAFAGKDRIFSAYKEALANNYRFYSFGDAMFVDKE